MRVSAGKWGFNRRVAAVEHAMCQISSRFYRKTYDERGGDAHGQVDPLGQTDRVLVHDGHYELF